MPISSRALNRLARDAWEEAQKRLSVETDAFRTFQKKYRYDLVGFVNDCIRFDHGGPTTYQNEILELIIEKKRVAIRGPHGLGKTALASWVVLWGVLTSDDVKVPTTASAWRQLTKFLWPEIHKWSARLNWDKIGREPFNKDELLVQSLKRSMTCEAFAVASNNHEMIEGAHAERMIYVYDEAKAIPDATFDATEGAFSGVGKDTRQEGYALAISTPGEPIGRFYDIHARKTGYEDWHAKKVTLDQAIAAGHISQEWADQRARQWGVDSAVYQNRVLGEFASSDEDGVISLAHIELANERWREWEDEGFPGELSVVGVDVARFGADQTIIAGSVEGCRVLPLREYSRQDTMATSGRVAGVINANPGSLAVVDVVGIGAGVVDRLREMGFEVVAFSAGEKTDYKDRSGELGFSDKRSASWWSLREILEPGSGIPIALPPDDDLIKELLTPKWRVMSGGKVKVESKADIRKRINRSTDRADAVIMALVGENIADQYDCTVSVLEFPW